MSDTNDRIMTEAEAMEEIEKSAAIAADPTVSPDQLSVLLEEYLDRVRYPRGNANFMVREKAAREKLGPSLARNPNAPLKIVIELARHHPQDVLANPVFPLLPLEHPDLVGQLGTHSLGNLLRFAECPPAFVRLCVDYNNAEVRFAAQEHWALTGEPDLHSMDWQEAAIDGLMALRMAVPGDVFDLLEAGQLPSPIAERFPAVHAPETPEEFGVMERRIQKFVRREQRRAKGKLPPVPAQPADGWLAWATELYNGDLKVATGWAEDPALPVKALYALATTSDPKARKTKKNPHPPAPKEVRKALARNPACPTEILDIILIYDNSRNIAAHPNVTPEILSRIVAKFPYGPELSIVAASPRATMEVLRRVYEVTLTDKFIYSYHAEARRRARWSAGKLLAREGKGKNDTELAPFRTMSEYQFRQIAARNSNDLIVWLGHATETAANSARPDRNEILQRWARHVTWWCRFAVAVNPHTPVEIRRSLTEDSCRPVRAAARLRLMDPAHPILGL